MRVLTISYLAHDGLPRRAYLILPAWYGPERHPSIPLVISPHGRGVFARGNVRRWGDLPARGGFAVINPEGQGRRLTLYSWGDPEEIRDLARMPSIVKHAFPWLQIDRHRVYAFGGSMGGQETLLLLARFPRLLAGAAAFDAPTNMAARYAAFGALRFGTTLQRRARIEIGGTPATDPEGYELRSPLDWARRIGIVHPRRSVLLGNGVDLSRFDPSLFPVELVRSLRRELGIPEQAFVVGTVARLVSEKGYREFFRAAASVRARFPEAMFLAVGPADPEKADQIGQEEVRRASRDVIFAGHRVDIPALLALMDVFVLASWREGVPRSAIEAAAAGKALVPRSSCTRRKRR